MDNKAYYAACQDLIDMKNSITDIEKDLKFMNSEVKYADMSDLDSVDTRTVSDAISNGEKTIKLIKDFVRLTDDYINSFGMIRHPMAELSDSGRSSLIKKAGRLYDDIYDTYSLYWCVYAALAKNHYVSNRKLQPYAL